MEVSCEICGMMVMTADVSIKPGMWEVQLDQNDIAWRFSATICAFCAQEFTKLIARLQDEGRARRQGGERL